LYLIFILFLNLSLASSAFPGAAAQRRKRRICPPVLGRNLQGTVGFCSESLWERSVLKTWRCFKRVGKSSFSGHGFGSSVPNKYRDFAGSSSTALRLSDTNRAGLLLLRVGKPRRRGRFTSITQSELFLPTSGVRRGGPGLAPSPRIIASARRSRVVVKLQSPAGENLVVLLKACAWLLFRTQRNRRVLCPVASVNGSRASAGRWGGRSGEDEGRGGVWGGSHGSAELPRAGAGCLKPHSVGYLEVVWGWRLAPSSLSSPLRFQVFRRPQAPPFDVKMTKLGFLRLSYEKQDTLLKLLILSMAAVLCKSASRRAGPVPGCRCPRRGPRDGAAAAPSLVFFQVAELSAVCKAHLK